jgi:hypothetical protein
LTAPLSEHKHLSDYLPLRKSMTEKDFLKTYWSPVLLVAVDLAAPIGGAITTQAMSLEAIKAAVAKRAESIVVVPIAKRMKDAFQSRIWVGREARCDVSLPFEGVSKLQAQFMREADGKYQIVDVGSTNGTFVNGAKLERNKPVPITDNIRLQFGPLETRFRTAEGFWEEIGRASART